MTAARHLQETVAIVGEGVTVIRNPSGGLTIVTRDKLLTLSARQAQQLVATIDRLFREAA